MVNHNFDDNYKNFKSVNGFKIDLLSEKILAEHSPQHLKDSVIRVSGHNKFYHAVCVPAKIMIEKKFLSTAYNPSEMPSTFIILSNK